MNLYMSLIVSKLLELQSNWKVQNHTQGPHKESMHSLISPQEELLVYYNIARCMRSGHGNCTVTGCYRTRNASLVRLKYTCIYLCSVRIVSGLIVTCTFL